MKKIMLVAAMATLTTVCSYGQGFVNYQGFLHGIGNNYTTPGTVTYNAGIDVELFFAPSTASSAVSAIAASSSPASLSYSVATAWSDILGDSNFAPVNGLSGAQTALASTAANGGFTYNGSSAYGANNLVGGTTYHMYEVAWYTGVSGTDNTLALASSHNEYVGWSQVFNYTPTTSGNPAPATFSSALVGTYLVGGTITPSPEPSTMALAALGGASLLLFRRRK